MMDDLIQKEDLNLSEGESVTTEGSGNVTKWSRFSVHAIPINEGGKWKCHEMA